MLSRLDPFSMFPSPCWCAESAQFREAFNGFFWQGICHFASTLSINFHFVQWLEDGRHWDTIDIWYVFLFPSLLSVISSHYFSYLGGLMRRQPCSSRLKFLCLHTNGSSSRSMRDVWTVRSYRQRISVEHACPLKSKEIFWICISVSRSDGLVRSCHLNLTLLILD